MNRKNDPLYKLIDKAMTPLFNKIEDTLDKIEEQEAEYERAKEENIAVRETFGQKAKQFLKTKGKKALIYTGVIGAFVGLEIDNIRMKIERYDTGKEIIQMVQETFGNKSSSDIEIVTEKPTIDENGNVVTQKDKEKEKEGITIESGDLIFSQDENGEYTLKEKTEENSFKQDLQEDVKKEEDLTQEELEQRAQDTQQREEVTPEINKTLE